MTTDNSLPTPPSASASTSATPTPASAGVAPAASTSQTADPAAAAEQPPNATATAPGATGTGAATSQQQQQQQSQSQPQSQPPPPTPAETLTTLLGQIAASNSAASLASTLLNFLPSPEARETVFVSMTDAGADPLEALDAAQHTIGVLFVLCVSHPLSIFLFLFLCENGRCGELCARYRRIAFFSFSFFFAGCVSLSARAILSLPDGYLVPLRYSRQVCTSYVHDEHGTCSPVWIYPELLPELQSRRCAPRA
jgi:hypothetical protein